MTVFPAGCPLKDDPIANESEKGWAAHFPNSRRDFVATAPRIRVETHQKWSVEPSLYQYFDVQQRHWVVAEELPWTPATDEERRRYEDWNGNGLVWLNEDCKRDGEKRNTRWSQSDDCGDPSLSLRQPGGGRRSHVKLKKRLATREWLRNWMLHR